MQTYLNYQAKEPNIDSLEKYLDDRLKARVDAGGGDFTGLCRIMIDDSAVYITGEEWKRFIKPGMKELSEFRDNFSNMALKIIKEKISEKISNQS